jgi:hypothetical protein
MRDAPGQQSLFPAPRTGRDEYADAKPIRLNPTVPGHEAPRLSAQHHAILDRLREGPATNLELGMICQRFGARLNELKRAGYPWRKECVKAGIYRYTLNREDHP